MVGLLLSKRNVFRLDLKESRLREFLLGVRGRSFHVDVLHNNVTQPSSMRWFQRGY